jgi:hypothetical protein
MGFLSFNPNLNPRDSITPNEIQDRAEQARAKLETDVKNALEAGGVPETTANRAAKSLASGKQSSVDKKNVKDAQTWYSAKNYSSESDWEE